MTRVLIDGNNLTARAYYVSPNLSREDGVKTGVSFVSLTILKTIAEMLKPDQMCICWDKGRSAKRLDMYPEYKIDRVYGQTEDEKNSYQDYRRQILEFKNYVSYLPVTQIECDHTEADDIIGYLCSLNIHKGIADDIIIVSMDKTFWQFIPYGVRVFEPIKKVFVDEVYIRKSCGVSAKNFLFFKAMVAMSSDNISGVKGFGESAAVSLLKEDVKDLAEIKERAMQFISKKKFKDFVEQFDIVVRNYVLMDLMAASDFIPEGSHAHIVQTMMNPKRDISVHNLRCKAFQDDMKSIASDMTAYLKPFRSLGECV